MQHYQDVSCRHHQEARSTTKGQGNHKRPQHTKPTRPRGHDAHKAAYSGVQSQQPLTLPPMACPTHTSAPGPAPASTPPSSPSGASLLGLHRAAVLAGRPSVQAVAGSCGAAGAASEAAAAAAVAACSGCSGLGMPR